MAIHLFARLFDTIIPQGSAASVLVEDVLQLVLRGAHDSIPNVRFTAVRALQEMAPHLDAGAVDSQVCGQSGRTTNVARWLYCFAECRFGWAPGGGSS